MKFLYVIVSLVGLVMFIYFGYLLIAAESAVRQKGVRSVVHSRSEP